MAMGCASMILRTTSVLYGLETASAQLLLAVHAAHLCMVVVLVIRHHQGQDVVMYS